MNLASWPILQRGSYQGRGLPRRPFGASIAFSGVHRFPRGHLPGPDHAVSQPFPATRMWRDERRICRRDRIHLRRLPCRRHHLWAIGQYEREAIVARAGDRPRPLNCRLRRAEVACIRQPKESHALASAANPRLPAAKKTRKPGYRFSRDTKSVESAFAVRVTSQVKNARDRWRDQDSRQSLFTTGSQSRKKQVKDSASGQVAQLVEQWTENPRVGSSILPLTTLSRKRSLPYLCLLFGCLGKQAHLPKRRPRSFRARAY